MSLLNDALRAAEERQNPAPVTSAYTGQPTASPARRGKATVVVAFVLLLLLAGGAAAWWLWPESRSTVTPADHEVASTGEIIRAPEQVPVAPAAAPEAEVLQTTVPVETRKMPVAETVAVTEAPEADEAVPRPEARKSEPTVAPVPAPRPAEAKAAVAEPKPKQIEQEAVATSEPRVPEAPVKQQRETPEAIDLRATRQMEKLLATGRTGEAERLLVDVSANQAAPSSRELFAREMLVQGMPERALNWLPDNITIEHASLRMLRARALLDMGELDRAVTTLTEKVPPVAEQPEYRVTLATLLQQAGQVDEAAGQWSELIAHDDSQATWWLGLAVALDAGGRFNSAARAYAQAVVLPGLSPSLVDYARERLNALRAES